jgi:hypothetical protein
MKHMISRCRDKRVAAGLLALSSLMILAASAPQPQSFSFALTNVYVAAYEDEKACHGMSLSSADLFLQSLPPAERAKYEAPEKRQELHKLMGERLGFKMVPTGKDSGPNGAMTRLTDAEQEALRQKYNIPKSKGISSFLGTRFAYDSCTNPEDFPFMAKGNEEYRGPIAYGIDLDGRTSKEDYVSPDQKPGVDNQLIRAVGCSFATRDFGNPKVADQVITSMSSPTLVEVTGVDDPLNDDDVTVRLYASANPLELSGAGKPLAWASLDIDPDRLFTAEGKGKIRNGELVTEPFDLRMRMREQIVDGYQEVRQARIQATIRPGEAIEGGIYGYQTLAGIEDSYHQSTQVGANLTRMSCPALVKAVRHYADAYPDPKTGRNTAISSALRFKGVPVFLIKAQQVPQGVQK